MKQMKYLLMALMCLISSSVMADDTPIPVEQLPEAAKTFVQTNFKGQKIVYAEKDWNSFECRLADGTKIEFTKKGAWKKIDRKAAAVPEAIVPAAIQEYESQFRRLHSHQDRQGALWLRHRAVERYGLEVQLPGRSHRNGRLSDGSSHNKSVQLEFQLDFFYLFLHSAFYIVEFFVTLQQETPQKPYRRRRKRLDQIKTQRYV